MVHEIATSTNGEWRNQIPHLQDHGNRLRSQETAARTHLSLPSYFYLRILHRDQPHIIKTRSVWRRQGLSDTSNPIPLLSLLPCKPSREILNLWWYCGKGSAFPLEAPPSKPARNSFHHPPLDKLEVRVSEVVVWLDFP